MRLVEFKCGWGLSVWTRVLLGLCDGFTEWALGGGNLAGGSDSSTCEPACTHDSWARVFLVSGTVVGVVLYTGRELRSVMNTSNPRSKVRTWSQDAFPRQNLLA